MKSFKELVEAAKNNKQKGKNAVDVDAYEEGYDAYFNGVKRTKCPYKMGTPERAEWLKGYDKADMNDDDGMMG